MVAISCLDAGASTMNSVIYVFVQLGCGDDALLLDMMCMLVYLVASMAMDLQGSRSFVSPRATVMAAAIGRSAACVNTLACRRTTPSMLPVSGAVVVGGVEDMWCGYATVRSWRGSGITANGILVPPSSSLVTSAELLAMRCTSLAGRWIPSMMSYFGAAVIVAEIADMTLLRGELPPLPMCYGRLR